MAAQRISVAQALAAADVEIFQDDGGGIPANAIVDDTDASVIVDDTDASDLVDG
jgi:hypothetical protein